MSHYLYYVCLSHDPYDESGEAGHNLSYLPELRKDLRQRQSLVTLIKLGLEKTDGWFELERGNSNANVRAWFLYYHRNCKIGIKSEYNKWYSVEGDSEEPIDAPDSSNSGIWVVYNWDYAPYLKSVHALEIDAYRASEQDHVTFLPYGVSFAEHFKTLIGKTKE